jgi:hypothetical protein
MKGTPKKETQELDTAAAMQAANALTAATVKPAADERPENEESKYIGIRIKETDYNRLRGFYGSKGLSMSQGMRMTAIYMADMVDQGAFTLSAGGYIDQRGRSK